MPVRTVMTHCDVKLCSCARGLLMMMSGFKYEREIGSENCTRIVPSWDPSLVGMNGRKHLTPPGGSNFRAYPKSADLG